MSEATSGEKQLPTIPPDRLIEFGGVYRQLIQQENEYWNHRMGWLLTLQSFLFAALAFAWKEVHSLVGILVVVGIVSAAVIGWMAHMANRTLKRLAEEWSARKGVAEEPPVIGHLSKWKVRWGFDVVLPGLFCLAWAAVFWIRWRSFCSCFDV